MSQTDPAEPPRPRLGRGLTLALWAALLIGAVAVLYVSLGSAFKQGRQDGLASLATGSMSKLKAAPEGRSAPAVAFTGPDGGTARLADFRGKVVVLNLWATWCAPCVKEMPTLAKLQAAYPDRVQVVALSNDNATKTADAKTFLAKHPPLRFYQDAGFAVMPALNLPAAGFPTTVIYDRAGVERAYLQGEADWSTPEARAVIDKALGE